ncbi:MAG TPA: outer membrane protein assembly factor BamE [Variovorax sp.]|nr:outer membrane protein assembly factor BamE [Variovorax sp.]
MSAGLLGAVLSFLGCDQQRIDKLEEGVSTEADVRKVFGEPEAVWESPAGRVFEYNRQPAGQKNYMITIGPDGKMAALRQVLTPENFAKVQAGMGAEELRKMLGKPASRKPYPLKNEVEWEWRWVQPPNTPMVFAASLSADDLRVLRSGSSHDRSTEAP